MNKPVKKKLKVSLFVVGAGKAGSTTMFDCLNKHPQLRGSNPKEPMFFSHYYSKGDDWYHSLFQKEDGIKHYFEASPQYTFLDEFPDVSSRIKAYNSNSKIIYIIRDPLERIVSHFQHWSRTKPNTYTNINRTLTDVKLRLPFIERTKYFKQITPYIELFGRENVKVVFLEDIKNNFKETINDVFRFIGVDDYRIDSTHSNKSNHVKSKSSSSEVDKLIVEIVTKELSEDALELLNYCGKNQHFWPAFRSLNLN
jgi:hypothetical protein